MTRNTSSKIVVVDQRKDQDAPREQNNDNIRFIPQEKFPFESDLIIVNNTIALVSDTEEFGVRIESQEFSEVIREAFELAWVEAGRLDASIRSLKSKSGEKRKK